MLTVLCYWWSDPATRHKFKYTADDVRLLARMVRRNLSVEHEFAVVTDQPSQFRDSDIRAIPLDPTTHISGTCFAKLMTFHPEGAEIFGERVFQIDLDTIVVGDLTPLVDRAEDLVLWRNPSRVPWDNPTKPGRPFYNTSFVLHTCGTRPTLWYKFDPKNPKCRDDQWWVSDRCGPDMPYWDCSHGVYRLGREDTPGSGVNGALPENARVVTFPGSEGKYFEPRVIAANPWIAKHLCRDDMLSSFDAAAEEMRAIFRDNGVRAVSA